jgi:glycosyltransferase involved in cell wall biosynthesis
LPEAPIIVTTLPIVADLVGVLRANRWVYYCVDDFSAWPGYDGATLDELERKLVPCMDSVVCASAALADRVRKMGASPVILTHGVDLAEFQNPLHRGVPPELEGLEEPFIVFWGVIDRRLDLSFLSELGRKLNRGTIALFGPEEDPDPQLRRIPRLAIRARVTRDRLPHLASASAALIMPYRNEPVTQAMQPLKLLEYLATDRPVVVRSLPSTLEWQDACDVVVDAAAFTAAVMSRIGQCLPRPQFEARGRVSQHTWERKAQVFRACVEGRFDASRVQSA